MGVALITLQICVSSSKNNNLIWHITNQKQGRKMAGKIFEFQVAMTCEGCSNQLKRVLDKHGQEKGIDGHEIDLPNKKVMVTSKTLQKGEVEEIIKKTGLETTFVGEKDA